MSKWLLFTKMVKLLDKMSLNIERLEHPYITNSQSSHRTMLIWETAIAIVETFYKKEAKNG